VARALARHIIMTKPGHIPILSIPDQPFLARGTQGGLIITELIIAFGQLIKL